jgi:hypothetical protein
MIIYIVKPAEESKPILITTSKGKADSYEQDCMTDYYQGHDCKEPPFGIFYWTEEMEIKILVEEVDVNTFEVHIPVWKIQDAINDRLSSDDIERLLDLGYVHMRRAGYY